VSAEVKDQIRRLPIFNPNMRLGTDGIQEIKEHPWLGTVDWNRVEEMPAVFISDTSKLGSHRQYFTDRYSFRVEDEGDIVEDTELSRRKSAVTGHTDDFMTQFPCVSLRQLEREGRREDSSAPHFRPSAANGHG